MRLRWTKAHDGAPVEYGFDGDLRVAQVVFYDVVAGSGPGWVGFVRGHTVSGRCADRDEAAARAEAAYSANPALGTLAGHSQRRM